MCALTGLSLRNYNTCFVFRLCKYATGYNVRLVTSCFSNSLRQHILGVIVSILLCAGSAVAQGQQSEDGEPRGSRSVTIAILPLVNISNNPSDESIALGITETIVSDLKGFSNFSVIETAAFFREENKSTEFGRPYELEAHDAAREFGVGWVVSGGVQRLGDELRVTLQIINLTTQLSYQAVKIDGSVDSLFSLQDSIVEQLRVQLENLAGSPAITTVEEGDDSSGAANILHTAETTMEEKAPLFGTEKTELSTPDGTRSADNEQLYSQASIRPYRTEIVPVIDGVLDDRTWQTAGKVTDFVQRQPLDGAPATEKTEVYLAYDSSTIYIGIHAHYQDPGIMRANRADRDRPIADDAVLVYFDPFRDQQRAYVFGVNGYGVQSDSILNARSGGGRGPGRGFGGMHRNGPGGAPRGDMSWDALYHSAGQIVEDGFTAELAIPFKSLRYPQRGSDTLHEWGFQIARTIRGKDESVVWSPVSRNVAGFLTQMGILEGMTGLSTSRNIEILPTFTAVQFGSLDAGSGSFANKDPEPEGGLNLKYGVTSNLTADFTYNPDFSQIETDQPQIELNQRFELFFRELRPFFLEGAEIFQFRGPVNLVHTRTIVDPEYGGKLTGKVGKTTVGVLYANDEAAGNLEDSTDTTYGQAAQTFIGRLRYDLYAESYIGALVTDREFMDGYNRVAGIDSNFRLGDTHSFGVRAVGSKDRDLDGLKTSGYLLNASFQKNGRNLTYAFGWYNLSPDFKTDVGFVERTDQRWTLGTVSYRWWPESWLINWGPHFTYTRASNFDGVLEDESASGGFGFRFAKNITVNTNIDRVMERFGGVNFDKTRYSTFATVSTNRRIAFGGGFNRGDQIFFDEENPYLGFDTGWNLFVNARPFTRLNSNINVFTNRFIDRLNNDTPVFDVKIFRALTTYQFTNRLLVRNISEYNSFDKKLGFNFLITYRLNAGTVFYAGYDDRYQRGNKIERDLDGNGINDRLFQSNDLQRTNRAVFVKLQYLFRY